MTTLLSHWTAQVLHHEQALERARTAQTEARARLTQAQDAGRQAAQAVRAATDAVDAARRALSGIPTPADGDPLLLAMSAARVDLAQARRWQAQVDEQLPLARERLVACDARLADAQQVLAAARTAARQAQARQVERQAAIDALTTGPWSTVVAEATMALATFEAGARARVEAEVPTHADADKSLLACLRARKALVAARAAQAARVEAQASHDSLDAVGRAQRAFDDAWAAVRQVIDLAPRLAGDEATLRRLSELPAPDATHRPIVTLAQHAALFRPGLKAAREAMLAKLSAADAAEAACGLAWETWRNKLLAGVKAHPDLTEAQLIAGPLAADFTTFDTARQARDTARGTLTANAADLAVLDAWLAAVSDSLWEALDQLDGAIDRLTRLKHPDIPAGLLATLSAREADLVTALAAAEAARRTQAAAEAAALDAALERQALGTAQLRRARTLACSTDAL